jgi:hypothetical protein
MPGNRDNINGHIDKHIDRQIESSLKDIDWSGLIKDRNFYKSPAAWEDEVLYFLLVDRFSNAKEYDGFTGLDGMPIAGPAGERTTPLFNVKRDAWAADRESWFNAGRTRWNYRRA